MQRGNSMILQEKLTKEILPELLKKYKVSMLELPKIEKVTINTGIGRIKESKEEMANVVKELTIIGGQKPKHTVAKISIAGFKLRKGQTVGYTVTLRGTRMYDFMERLINIVLPRCREFEGISKKCFDKNGNFTVSIKEQSIFPELKADEIKQVWGMGITFSIKNGQNKETLYDYLKAIGFVFEKEQQNG